jgi:cobalt/nickel transport system permease protein
MILLAASTNFSKLLKAFEKLGIPKIITMILSFMYRYIFVVQDELMKMREAKESRSVGGSRWFHIKTLANMVGVLFIRTYERGESVYLAMCARGFDGSIKIIDSFQLKRRDFSFILVLVGLLIFIRLFGG